MRDIVHDFGGIIRGALLRTLCRTRERTGIANLLPPDTGNPPNPADKELKNSMNRRPFADGLEGVWVSWKQISPSGHDNVAGQEWVAYQNWFATQALMRR